MPADLTVVFYTSNHLPEPPMLKIRERLALSCRGFPIVSVSQKPIAFGENICVGEIGANSYNLYKQVLIGAKAAKTEFVSLCEDDCLYPPSHFTNARPTDFGYNMNRWILHTWDKNPIYSYKTRHCLHALICPRDLLVEHLEERFSKNHIQDQITRHYGEPGRWMHEQCLGVTRRPLSGWKSPDPCIIFMHPYSLNYKLQGDRRAYGRDAEPTVTLAPWGNAKELIEHYWITAKAVQNHSPDMTKIREMGY